MIRAAALVAFVAVCLFAVPSYGQCFNGATPASINDSTVCPLYNTSSCCSRGDLNMIQQRQLIYQLLTGDRTNRCFRILSEMECARCNTTSATFMSTGLYNLCNSSCELMYDYCQTYLFGLQTFCTGPQSLALGQTTSVCLQLSSASGVVYSPLVAAILALVAILAVWWT